jgi:hypothetical protein
MQTAIKLNRFMRCFKVDMVLAVSFGLKKVILIECCYCYKNKLPVTLKK